MRNRPRRRARAPWTRLEIDPEKALGALRELGALGDHLVLAWAYYDARGQLRRVVGDFADGWRATLYLSGDGSGHLQQSIRLRSEAPR